jgi:CRISPR-associated exonuclease Cas4
MDSPLGKITEVTYIKDRRLFPISWLNKQAYCEYQIYLENVKGIKIKPTQAMVTGKDEHEALYNKFAETAVPATVDQMLAESKTAKIYSRELRVVDLEHGIFGYIDEVRLAPDSFTIIDDKPGNRVFVSSIHQVYGYCLAFRTVLQPEDNRSIVAALRERGTENIHWQNPFDNTAREEVISVIEHIHSLLAGKREFQPADNPNKCRRCRFNAICDKISDGIPNVK